MSCFLGSFLEYARYDLRLSEETIDKYERGIRRVIGILGDGDVSGLTLQHFLEVKRQLTEEGVGPSWAATILHGMKGLLKYCREVHGIAALDPSRIRPPRPPRRDVIYLTKEEVERFLEAIPTHKQQGLRFRTLCEVLLGTAMRISEALSLDRHQIDFYKREATIVGKGNKERVVFFTERSLDWVKRYLATREDAHPAIFASRKSKRLRRDYGLTREFARYRAEAGITKKVTPHIFRHTAATLMLNNGCPINHVSKILGHERLETTCRYYLGLDKKEAKAAHERFMRF